MYKSKWWKNPKFSGTGAYILTKCLSITLRYKIQKHTAIDQTAPYLFAFWHGQQWLPALLLNKHHDTPSCVMVSPSRDGAILAILLEKLGYSVTRGSSRDNGLRALLAMKTSLAAGRSVGFGIDGPIGPIYKVKPGIAFLAQKCQVPIIPVGSAFSKSWIFHKAWDKFSLPKPFARASLVLGEPIMVDADADLEAVCKQIELQVQSSEQTAQQLLG